MIGIDIGIGMRTWGGTSAPAIDYYVDSVSGSDSNAGTLAAPFQTLAKVASVSANNKRIALKRGSTWREALNLSAYSGVSLEPYGSGAAPVITGFDVVTGWTDDTATVAGRWYKDVAHNGATTNRQVVLQDNALMRRVANAAAVSASGTYYSADCGTGATIRVYINVGAENPNSNGKTYEVTTRQNCGFFGEDATVTGIVFRGAISNNGVLETGKGATVSRCLAAFGTKHNALVPSGAITDVVFFDNDMPSASEPSNIPFVAYDADLRGENITLTRCMFWSQYTFTDFIYSHTSSDPTNRIDSMVVDQCVGHAEPTYGGGTAVVSAGDTTTLTNSCFTGKINSIFAPYSADATATRVIGQVTSDAGAFRNQNASSNLTVSQCAASREASGGTRGFIDPLANQVITLNNCSFDSTSDFYGQALGPVSATTYSLTYNRMLVESNNGVSIPSTVTAGTIDNNLYSRPGGGIGPYATWNGTGYDLSSAFASWRTASGKDANSAAVTSTPFTGTTTNGDFTLSAAALINGAYSGMTEHWDFNTRSVVSTPPTRWAVGPRTYAEALTYIEDPEAWDFYP